MKIFYSENHPIPQELHDMIADHSLSHNLLTDELISDIYLVEGGLKVEGIEEIKSYLIDLIKEVKQGWYCQCEDS